MAGGSCIDDGGQSQPACGARGSATRMGWSGRKNSRGGTGGQFRVPGGSAAGGQRISGSRACCAGSRRISETGTRKQQCDCCQARGLFRERTHGANRKTLGIGRGEGADEQRQGSADSRRGTKQEGILSGRDGGGGFQEPDSGRTNLDEDPGCHAGICERDARNGAATYAG